MNQNFKTVLMRMRHFFFVFILLITSIVQGQELSTLSSENNSRTLNQNPYKTISFGEKINFGKVENSILWFISFMDAEEKVTLIGNEINNYIFETPGSYQITFKENKLDIAGECNHTIFPEMMLITVSPFKMDYDFSTIQFNKNIVAGEDIENIEVTLNVSFKSFNKNSVVFSKGKMISAGIGTTITGELLADSITLKPGINKLVYRLRGNATKDTYIMLDFFDINNQIQTYYFQTKL